MTRTIRVVGQNRRAVVLGPVARLAHAQAIRRVAAALLAGATIDVLWPGIERQPDTALEPLWEAVDTGIRHGGHLRIHGYRFRRLVRLPSMGPSGFGEPCGRVELVVPALSQSVRLARRLVDRLAAGSSWTRPECHDYVLAISEALSNAVRHGSPQGGRDLVALGLCVHAGGLIADILDRGRWNGRTGSREHQAYGRGVAIMRASVDEVGVSRVGDGTVVTLVKWDRVGTSGGSVLVR